MTELASLPAESIRIGDCLIKEGFATATDVAQALKIQLQKEKQLKFSKKTIIPPLNGISKGQRKALLHHPPLGDNIGLVCVQRGLITKQGLFDLLQE